MGEAALLNSIDVLIAENDENIRETLAIILETELNIKVMAVSNGRQALEVLKTTIPRLIISDIKMPQLSGLELHTMLAKDLRYYAIPIILMTGFGYLKEEAESRHIFVIKKPFNLKLLLTAVKLLLAKPEDDPTLDSFDDNGGNGYSIFSFLRSGVFQISPGPGA